MYLVLDQKQHGFERACITCVSRFGPQRCFSVFSGLLACRRVILSQKQPVFGRFNMFKTPKLSNLPKTLGISRILCSIFFSAYSTCWPTEIKVFHRRPTEMTGEPVESLKFSREPTEMTYCLTENIPKANWNNLLANWKIGIKSQKTTKKPEKISKANQNNLLANWKIGNQVIWKATKRRV